MKSYLYILSFCLFTQFAAAQNLYFPPIGSQAWETLSPDNLNWCPEKIDSLYAYLNATNAKAFVVLKDGKIVLEKYFDAFTKDSIWYYASAGKSVSAVLTGIAQQEGLLKLTDKTSQYLGAGWTSCTPEQEDRITVWHQLTMTSGLDDSEEDLNGIAFCTDPACLKYKADAGTRWAYHNAPYLLIHNVLEEVAGQNINQFFRSRLGSKIGMTGFWVNGVLYGKARDAARFGLLALAKGSWNGTPVLTDATYFQQMTNTSQNLNKSYGYLWWLNGKESFKLPTLQLTFPGSMIPSAPADMYMALGKNDQKIYVIPNRNMVVVRFGETAGGVSPAFSSFDNELWQRISDLECTTSANDVFQGNNIVIAPNPAHDFLHIEAGSPIAALNLFDLTGKLVFEQKLDNSAEAKIPVSHFPKGVYFLKILTENGWTARKVAIGW